MVLVAQTSAGATEQIATVDSLKKGSSTNMNPPATPQKQNPGQPGSKGKGKNKAKSGNALSSHVDPK